MINKKDYSNGQKVQILNGNKLTYFFKNGKVKADGRLINDKMEGEWKFYRETGQLWQIGNFKNDMKNGAWLRYDKDNKLEYQEIFRDNKIVKSNLNREK
jgi:antitoxin component YwqK of YwqJK toxin-antitoxin module